MLDVPMIDVWELCGFKQAARGDVYYRVHIASGDLVRISKCEVTYVGIPPYGDIYGIEAQVAEEEGRRGLVLAQLGPSRTLGELEKFSTTAPNIWGEFEEKDLPKYYNDLVYRIAEDLVIRPAYHRTLKEAEKTAWMLVKELRQRYLKNFLRVAQIQKGETLGVAESGYWVVCTPLATEEER